MAVDIKKIKVGDKITMEVVVLSLANSFSYKPMFHCKSSDTYDFFVYAKDIVGHTPAQVPVRIGQKFRFVANSHTIWEIVAEYKGRVVYASSNTYSDGSFPIYSTQKAQLQEAWLPINEDN